MSLKSGVNKATKAPNKKCKERGKRKGEEQIYFVIVENFQRTGWYFETNRFTMSTQTPCLKSNRKRFGLDR